MTERETLSCQAPAPPKLMHTGMPLKADGCAQARPCFMNRSVCYNVIKTALEELSDITQAIGVAEAKKRFSELMSKTLYKGERFIIERKGKPVAAMVSVDDLRKLEAGASTTKKKGLLAAVGAWADYRKLDQVVADIYHARHQALDRPVKKLG